jgi:3-mercaptopyruvate sulfurtransferase SseA
MSGFVHPEYMVTTEWLAAHLDDPSVIVLDCTMLRTEAFGQGKQWRFAQRDGS